MVLLKVREVAQERGVIYIKDLAERAGLAYDTAADLWHGRMQRVDRDVLSRVCAALGCSVGDVMVYVSDERKKEDEEDIEALVSVT